jgi:hypothetical protein
MGIGAFVWLALWGLAAFVATEAWHPEWPERRKDVLHNVAGKAAGAGFAILGLCALSLRRKER